MLVVFFLVNLIIFDWELILKIVMQDWERKLKMERVWRGRRGGRRYEKYFKRK